MTTLPAATLSQPAGDGGLGMGMGMGMGISMGMGTVITSALFLAVILALVVYLAVTRRDVTGPDRAARHAA
ncbi:hypothetical protein GCM10010510_49470 [Streptomyces anandii JCM 4720]|nr:hypothetical protein [Streptomyces anandii]GGX98027.1 hypothetical protein GCM10010510_49470 [Streptomyces anandii JCM 4720]